jgi:NADH-quinone oxidoreductase subunit J
MRYKPVAIAFAIVLLLQVVVIVDSSELANRTSASLASDFGSVQAVGVELFTNYLYAFELTSVLLIVAVLGAVVMAKRSL